MKSSREAPQQKALDRISYGRYPANYQDLIKKFLSARLSDPDSGVYRFGTPYRGYVLLEGSLGPMTLGYIVDVRIKVKTQSGKYGKEQPYTFFIKDDSIRLIVVAKTRSDTPARYHALACKV